MAYLETTFHLKKRGRLTDFCKNFWTAYKAHRRHQIEAMQVARLPDHMLADIGLRRDPTLATARQPLGMIGSL